MLSGFYSLFSCRSILHSCRFDFCYYKIEVSNPFSSIMLDRASTRAVVNGIELSAKLVEKIIDFRTDPTLDWR